MHIYPTEKPNFKKVRSSVCLKIKYCTKRMFYYSFS